jgi:leader peptidase (prepilin peptidase)/N-methyltransferase
MEQPVTDTEARPLRPALREIRVSRWAIALAAAAVLVGLTFARVHPVGNATLYAVAQVLLVAMAAIDLATRRIPNLLVLALAVLAIVPRSVGERSELTASLVSGVVVFAVALVLAYAARGGLGMGDVKLAGALGLVLGSTVLPALVVGTMLGAVAGLAIIVRQGAAGRRSALAYGPYLAAGAALAILFFGPPALV